MFVDEADAESPALVQAGACGAIVAATAMLNTAFDSALVNVYRQRGLVTADEPPRGADLRTCCEHADTCWRSLGADAVPEAGRAASELSPPWVGDDYATGRTVIVMENLLNYGGFALAGENGRGMRHLGVLARKQLKERRRLFPSGKYRGTDVWTRGLDYAAAWLLADGVIDAAKVTDAAHERLAALELVAIVQHVKCPPATARSEQPQAMWENCGKHVLAGELDIMRPERIIVLGTGENADAMREHVLPGEHRTLAPATFRIGQRTVRLSISETDAAWGRVAVFVAPHPAGRGGNARGLLGVARAMFGEVRAARASRPT